MRDAGDEDDAPLIVDRINDAVVADSNAEVTPTHETLCAGWPRLRGKAVDRLRDPALDRIV
jgi:hypothetical protein